MKSRSCGMVRLPLDSMNRKLLRSLAAVVGMSALVAGASEHRSSHLSGSWGGREAALTVRKNAADLTFPCGAGHIKGSIAIGRNGRFDVAGTFTHLHGAPPPRGASFADERVRYRGRVSGTTLTLIVQFAKSEETYTLTRGAADQVPRCG